MLIPASLFVYCGGPFNNFGPAPLHARWARWSDAYGAWASTQDARTCTYHRLGSSPWLSSLAPRLSSLAPRLSPHSAWMLGVEALHAHKTGIAHTPAYLHPLMMLPSMMALPPSVTLTAYWLASHASQPRISAHSRARTRAHTLTRCCWSERSWKCGLCPLDSLVLFWLEHL